MLFEWPHPRRMNPAAKLSKDMGLVEVDTTAHHTLVLFDPDELYDGLVRAKNETRRLSPLALVEYVQDSIYGYITMSEERSCSGVEEEDLSDFDVDWEYNPYSYPDADEQYFQVEAVFARRRPIGGKVYSFGPTMYQCALKSALARDTWLMGDRKFVSKGAYRMWEGFMEDRTVMSLDLPANCTHWPAKYTALNKMYMPSRRFRLPHYNTVSKKGERAAYKVGRLMYGSNEEDGAALIADIGEQIFAQIYKKLSRDEKGSMNPLAA